MHLQTTQIQSQNFTSHCDCLISSPRFVHLNRKTKIASEHCREFDLPCRKPVDSKIAGHLNQVLVNYLINRNAVLYYIIYYIISLNWF